ncbi:M48 family metallopeptidase [Treponema phagedenis]|nr:M48 family metallopeptidase [Treponema phagedenis]
MKSGIMIDSIYVEVWRKNIKTIRLVINPRTGEPRVSAPMHVSDEELLRFIEKYAEWIKKNRKKMKARRDGRESQRRLNEGDTVPLWGEPHRIRIDFDAKRATVSASEGVLHFKLPHGADIIKKNEVLERLYKRELKTFIEEILPHWENKTKEKVSVIRYRSMRSRWGTCNPRDKIITLNTKLAAFPYECAEVVLVHEIAHFKEASHNAKFKSYLTKFLPDWKKRQDYLKEAAY